MLTTGGTGNLNGDYWKKTAHGWKARIEPQAAWLAARRRDTDLEWFLATELHAEHSAHQPLMEALGQDWGVVTNPGGNLLLYVKDRVEVVGVYSDHSTERWISKMNVRNPYHPETKYWIVGDHLISGSTAKIEAEKVREVENGNRFCRTPSQIHRGFRAGDFNARPGSKVWEALAAAGWRSVKHKCPEDKFVDRDLNTGLGWGHDGNNIDDVRTHDMVDVLEARFWDARPLTDHSAFLTLKANVHDKIIAAPIV